MANPGDIDIIIVLNRNVSGPETLAGTLKEKYPWLKFQVLQRHGSDHNYGAVVRFGLAYSTSKYAVLLSPYGDDDISIITPMLSQIRKGVQVVQASRYTSPDDYRNVQLRFRIYQHIYRFLTWLFLGVRISDSTYGFKMFDRVFIQALGMTHNGYSVCPEITLKSLLAGGKVAYISSTVKVPQKMGNFRLYREGFGYILLLLRGFLHRLGIRWF